MSQNLPKGSLRDFLSLRHPNHFVLASANNRNVIINYQEPITWSLHLPYKPLEWTLSEEKLFIKIAFAEYFSRLLSNIQSEQSYDHTSHDESQKRDLNCCQQWVVSKTKHSKTKTEARSTQISKTKHLTKTKHPKLEHEAPKNSKTKIPKLETGLSFINTRQPLANTAGIKHDNVRVLHASLTLRFQSRFRPFVLVLAHTCIRQNTVRFEVYINMYVYRKKMHIEIRCIKYSESETNNKINTGYPI